MVQALQPAVNQLAFGELGQPANNIESPTVQSKSNSVLLIDDYVYMRKPVGAAILVAVEDALAVAIEHDLLVEDGEAERGIVRDFGREVERIPLFSPVVLCNFLLLLFFFFSCFWRNHCFFIGVFDYRSSAVLSQPSSSPPW